MPNLNWLTMNAGIKKKCFPVITNNKRYFQSIKALCFDTQLFFMNIFKHTLLKTGLLVNLKSICLSCNTEYP